MKWGVAVAVILEMACVDYWGRTHVGDCTYEESPAKCGELLIYLSKNYRTDELHPLTEDLRYLIAKQGGSILMNDAALGIIIATFDPDEEKLARVLDLLRQHPAVRSADYNWVSTLDE